MKLKIKTVVEVAGKTINPFWKSPMYLVNGEYVASSISAHNIDGLTFSLEVGEDAEVSLRAHNGDMWIARLTTKETDK